MKYREVSIIVFWHTAFFVFGTILVILLFQSPLFDSTIFFYRGLAIILLVGLLMSFILTLLRKSRHCQWLTVRDVIIFFLLLVSINTLFFTHIPVTADRSVSIFLLGHMNTDSDTAYTKEDLSTTLINKYIYENDGIEKRFHEQVFSGNIVQDGDRYSLSNQGKTLIKFYVLVAKIFNINTENLSE